MKSRVFLASLGAAGAAVLVGQLAAIPQDGKLLRLSSDDDRGKTDGGGQPIIDVDPCRIGSLNQFGSVGTYPEGTVGLALTTTGHNNGNINLPWFDSPRVHHPLIAQNMYRVNADGRLEQIGLAWLKHAWFAVQGTSCGSCNSSGTGEQLGPGCADTYSSGLNADQFWLGPRWEITPEENIWMDGQSWSGSHFARNGADGDSSSHNPVQHRLRVRMSDLDDADATYFYEGFYVLLRKLDDPNWSDIREPVENLFNNATHDRVNVNRSGNNFSFTEFNQHNVGPVVMAWGDMQSMVQPGSDPGPFDPVSIVSSRSVDLGNGQWRYEYAVMNYTDSAGLDEVKLPVGTANVTDIGFHAPRDGYWTDSNTFVNEAIDHTGTIEYDFADWNSSVDSGFVTFTPPTPQGEVLPNTIRWGTMYTFWFTADQPPLEAPLQAQLGRAGASSSYVADIVGPSDVAPVVLTAIDTTFGDHVSGGVAEVETSDDNRYISRSAFGFSAQEPNMVRLRVRGTSSVADAPSMEVTLEGLLDNPGGQQRVSLFNYDTGANVLVDTRSIGNTETTQTINVNGPIAPFIRDTDLRVQLQVRASVIATFSAAGFESRYDLIEMTMPR